MGGAIFNFSQKIGLKTTKMVRFCILHKPMGGGRAPPPPGYATGCGSILTKCILIFTIYRFFSLYLNLNGYFDGLTASFVSSNGLKGAPAIFRVRFAFGSFIVFLE